jgi:tetratricopeptide (TPR) repeat protein
VPALLDEIDDADADERTRARAAHLRGRHLVLAGRPRKAMFILRDGAAAIERVDPTAAALMLIEGSAAANHSGDVDVSIEMAQRACELTLEASPEGTLATVALGAALVASGRRSEGHDLLIRYPELLSQPDLLATAVPMLMAVASGLVWLEQFDDAIELLDPFIALARRSGAVGTLPLALALKGWAHQRISQTTAAEAALVESLQLADETGQHTIALQARATLAALYNGLLRGAELRAHTSVVRRSTSPGSGGARTGTTMALGGLLLAENRLDEAVELLTEIADPSDPGATLDNSTHHAAFVNLADAYLRLGRREDAARVAELLGRTGRERGIDWTLGHAERLAGLLAPTTPSTRTSRRRAGCCGAFRLCGWPSSVRGGSGCALPAATTRLGFTSTPRCARRAPPGSGGGPTGPSPSCGRWGRTWPRSTRPPPLL